MLIEILKFREPRHELTWSAIDRTGLDSVLPKSPCIKESICSGVRQRGLSPQFPHSEVSATRSHCF